MDHLRGLPAAVGLLRHLVESGEEIAASELVRFELIAGAREEERDALEELFKVPSWVPVDADLLTTNVRHFPMLTGLKPPY